MQCTNTTCRMPSSSCMGGSLCKQRLPILRPRKCSRLLIVNTSFTSCIFSSWLGEISSQPHLFDYIDNTKTLQSVEHILISRGYDTCMVSAIELYVHTSAASSLYPGNPTRPQQGVELWATLLRFVFVFVATCVPVNPLKVESLCCSRRATKSGSASVVEGPLLAEREREEED